MQQSLEQKSVAIFTEEFELLALLDFDPSAQDFVGIYFKPQHLVEVQEILAQAKSSISEPIESPEYFEKFSAMFRESNLTCALVDQSAREVMLKVDTFPALQREKIMPTVYHIKAQDVAEINHILDEFSEAMHNNPNAS